MASSVSLEYLTSQKGATNGIASLDGTGKIPSAQLPNTAIETFKGTFATNTALTTAHSTGETGDYAYVTSTLSYWYWNAGLTTPAWANQETSATAYLALTANAKAGVQYIITS